MPCGCADFEGLMRHRAGKSRLEGFEVGGRYYPAGLGKVVGEKDPEGMVKSLGEEEVGRRLRGKSLLVLSGGADKLVPWECSRGFVERCKGMEGVRVKSIVYEGVGHLCTDEMVEELALWVKELMQEGVQAKV